MAEIPDDKRKPSIPPPEDAEEVRRRLVRALQLDLVGPETGVQGAEEYATEALPGWQRPSSWYLTGFLIPAKSKVEDSAEPDEDDQMGVEDGSDPQENAEDSKAAKKGFFPSSMGISFLVPEQAKDIRIHLTWGDYLRDELEKAEGKKMQIWRRHPRSAEIVHELTGPGEPHILEVADSGGLEIHMVERSVKSDLLGDRIPAETRSLSVFLVNNRTPLEKNKDERFVFQPRLELKSEHGFTPRPELRTSKDSDWDERVSDLQYRDCLEYATGHGVSASWDEIDGKCHSIHTVWVPSAEVERTETVPIEGVELSMDTLGQLKNAEAVKHAFRAMPDRYAEWIAEQKAVCKDLDPKHREVAEELLVDADAAKSRIEEGIDVLAEDTDALDAFRVANRAVSRALKKRLGIDEPKWRAFQLAYILLNLKGIAEPTSTDREIADLLFFPTGGGKTEAYLGLAAFTMVLRRLRNPEDKGNAGAGISVIMRYTLRLLTLDQLNRATGLMCAVELERSENPDRYGTWPFEIGLWVGKKATPNHLGKKGDGRSETARSLLTQYKGAPQNKPKPIPLDTCPWCGADLNAESFNLRPNLDYPDHLEVRCPDPELTCEFGERALPVVAVDESIYRRLPAFVIATIDKFASLPWEGRSGLMLGGAERADKEGFYGPMDPTAGRPLKHPLPPPDLIIQDELHLVSGPLGTMAGLLEGAIDALCKRELNGKAILPKVIASTATVKKADAQIQALFARVKTSVFPPQGPNRGDSFFSRTRPASEVPARLYLGVSAQGKNPKVMLRRTWLALMATAFRSFMDAGGYTGKMNPADPYMTVLGYFNSLRELGGARRILEEEVRNTLKGYGKHKRLEEKTGLFQSRTVRSEVMELTSRVPTEKVANARRSLGLEFLKEEKEQVNWALATNMISVGLDIQRLGLMVVFGQPKTHAEYIQATSRVGRDEKKPGLVVTLYNIHKPRDRSHYERFRGYHETFYRSVEASSLTPFSSRALDRGFSMALVTLARFLEPSMTPAKAVEQIETHRAEIESRIRSIYTDRVENEPNLSDDEKEKAKESVIARVSDLIDSWISILRDHAQVGNNLQYQKYELQDKKLKPLLRYTLDDPGSNDEAKFRLNRSLRDVEPEVHLFRQK